MPRIYGPKLHVENIRFKLTTELKRRLDSYSEESGIPISVIVRRLLDKNLPKLEEDAK